MMKAHKVGKISSFCVLKKYVQTKISENKAVKQVNKIALVAIESDFLKFSISFVLLANKTLFL